MHPELTALMERQPELAPCLDSLTAAFARLRDSFAAGGTLLICGNGGSAADSDHIVGELMKGFERKRPIDDALRQRLQAIDTERGAMLAARLQGALPAVSLAAHTALTTAISNDVDGDMMFAQQVMGYGRAGDVLLAISTSGQSRSVLNALHVARARDVITIGLSGQTGGAMPPLCDVMICVPYTRTRDIQERHLAIYHTLCVMLEEEFFA